MSLLDILKNNRYSFPKESHDFQSARLIKTLLVLMMITLFIFGSLDAFRFNLRSEAITNYASFLLVVLAFIYFQLTKNIRVSATITVLLVTIITLFSIIQ